jgi:hypothetical protein
MRCPYKVERPIKKEYVMDDDLMHDIQQIVHVLSNWLRPYLARELKVSPNMAGDILDKHMINLCGGVLMPSSGPYDRITVSLWQEKCKELGCDGMIREGYYVFRKYDIGLSEKQLESLDKFVSTLVDAISDIHNRHCLYNWVEELLDNEDSKCCGGWFGNWVKLRSKDFKRAFSKIWKEYQRDRIGY